MARRLSDDAARFIDALRLSQRESSALFDELDRAHGGRAGVDKRKNKRLPYRSVRGLILQVTHPGGTTARFLVKPRNISNGGVGVLHGGFIHPGTRCMLLLKNNRGEAAQVNGRIVACRLIRGRIHELGIAFDHGIRAESYILDADVSDAADGEPVTLPTLRGRVLVVDEWRDDRELLLHDLQTLGLHPQEADGGADTIHRVRNERFDLILTGEWLGDMTAADLAGALRDTGCTTPLIGVFASEGAAGAARAVAAGVAAVLQKPWRVEGLAQALMQFLNLRGGDAEGSSKRSEPPLPPTALAFLHGLEAHLDHLARCLQGVTGGNAPMHACMGLKAAAAAHGLPRISQAAEELTRLVAEGAPFDTLNSTIRQIADLAATARSAAARP